MNRRRLYTKQVEDSAGIKDFFDAIARVYGETHGNARRLLRRRLALIRRFARIEEQVRVLEIGCGRGDHLLALAGRIHFGLGIDLSDGMIREARRIREGCPERHRLAFRVDNAETLATVADGSFDLVLCVGALEHMLDKEAVFRSARRVLAAGGRFMWKKHTTSIHRQLHFDG
jgi:2-polyprenyl-6-hydroxyphenyl methylase/3-demethylubiquinone-9 3-methyltransferase